MFQKIKNKKLKLNQIQEAFSLVEIIIVLFIISLGLVGILSLIVQNVQSQNYNKNNLIGYQLSQEGIELIRRERDSNWLATPYNGFAYNIVPESNVVYSYCLDFTNTTPNNYETSDVACPLNFNSIEGLYVHDNSWPASGFSRLIKVEMIENGSALRVISEVYWQNPNGAGSYITEALLYDWYF